MLGSAFLWERFFSTGVGEVDREILPKLAAKAEYGVIPRVLPSYSILYWFSNQVCIKFSRLMWVVCMLLLFGCSIVMVNVLNPICCATLSQLLKEVNMD